MSVQCVETPPNLSVHLCPKLILWRPKVSRVGKNPVRVYVPLCKFNLSWARKSVSVCRCGYDWRRIRSPVIGDEELVAARWISSIWRGRNEKSFRLGEATASPLAWEGPAVYPAALSALMDAWLYLRKGVRLQPTTENELCHCTVAAVASALDDWPEGFFRFFDQFDDPALENWQRAWFGHRSGNLSETQGWLLAAAALEEYLEVRWAGAQVPAVPKRFLSKQEAGQHLGLGVNLIDSLVEQGRLRSLRGVIKRNISWIDYRSLKRLRQEIESMLTVSQAAADLGIGSRQFRDLVRYGFLSPESSLRFDRADEPKFSPKALTAFLHRLRGLVTLPDEGRDEFRVVSLSRVADHLELHELSFGQFVQAIFAGFPLPVIEREASSGRLSRFWFRADEINQYLNSQFDPDKRPAAPLYTLPSLRRVVEWLDGKQEDGDNRFYRPSQQPLNATNLKESFGRIYATDQLRRIMQSLGWPQD